MKQIWRSKILKSELMKTVILILIALACVGVFWITLRAVLRNEYPLEAVVSESMVPTLNVGDLVVVYGVPSADEINAVPKTGDIIVFRKPTDPSEFIVHRAIEKIYRDGQWLLTTKGDNNLSSLYFEKGFSEDYLIGKVVVFLPLLGYFKIFLDTPGGMVVYIILLILLFVDYIPLKRGKNSKPSLDN